MAKAFTTYGAHYTYQIGEVSAICEDGKVRIEVGKERNQVLVIEMEDVDEAWDFWHRLGEVIPVPSTALSTGCG